MNLLWRNQLLAIAIEQADSWPYREVYFSVVHHPRNGALNDSIEAFLDLIDGCDRFSSFTPEPIVSAAEGSGVPGLDEWAKWYSELYAIT